MIIIPEEIKDYYEDWYKILAFDNYINMAAIVIVHKWSKKTRMDIWELKNNKFELKFEGHWQ